MLTQFNRAEPVQGLQALLVHIRQAVLRQGQLVSQHPPAMVAYQASRVHG